ncbi:MAG: ParB/RepB/Spo0J family partition protein [Armatimonadia bacterium]|nr:ParB/RepB/Spo0J family partition protein [Armatimonadia bacterium]
MQNRGLGKGLSSLIPGGATPEGATAIPEVPIDQVRPNPSQPRRSFDEDALNELAQSISAQGIIQPLVVRAVNEEYELIAGERRWRAARVAGMTHVPVVVREADDADMLKMALVENVQREDLNPIDRALAYRALVEDFATTQEALAEALGRSRTSITNTMRLLRLPPEIQDRIASGHLSEGHGRALLSVANEAERHMIWRKIEASGLTVRDAEDLVRKATERGKPEKETTREQTPSEAPADPFVEDLEDRLRTGLGTDVQIKQSQKGAGTITIRFYDADDLDRLTRLILAMAEVPSGEELGLHEPD